MKSKEDLHQHIKENKRKGMQKKENHYIPPYPLL